MAFVSSLKKITNFVNSAGKGCFENAYAFANNQGCF